MVAKLATGAEGCTSFAAASSSDRLYGPVEVDVAALLVRTVEIVVVAAGSPNCGTSCAVTPRDGGCVATAGGGRTGSVCVEEEVVDKRRGVASSRGVCSAHGVP